MAQTRKQESRAKKPAVKGKITRKDVAGKGAAKGGTAAPVKQSGKQKAAAANGTRKPAVKAGANPASRGIAPEERRAMIAVAAYHRAASRGFPPGGDIADWLEAEREIDILIAG